MLHHRRIDKKIDKALELSLTEPDAARNILWRISIHHCSEEQLVRRQQILDDITKRNAKKSNYKLMKDIIDYAIQMLIYHGASHPKLQVMINDYLNREEKRLKKTKQK